jgi:DNA-directed RNA polymerase subunit F
MSDVRGKSATAMSRTKKPSKLSADERAFLNRIRSLNEEETEKLTFEETIAYLNIMHKIDPRSIRHAFEEVFIDRGLTNSAVLRLLEGAKERAKWKQ